MEYFSDRTGFSVRYSSEFAPRVGSPEIIAAVAMGQDNESQKGVVSLQVGLGVEFIEHYPMIENDLQPVLMQFAETLAVAMAAETATGGNFLDQLEEVLERAKKDILRNADNMDDAALRANRGIS